MFDSVDEAAGYVAALIDGEGSVGTRPDDGVRIFNTDISIIRACEEALDVLDIKYSTVLYNANHGHKAIHRVGIYGQENLKWLADVVTLRSANKNENLRILVASYKRKPYYSADRVPKKQWKKWYVSQKMGTREIASLIGCGKSTVSYNLKKHGIPLR